MDTIAFEAAQIARQQQQGQVTTRPQVDGRGPLSGATCGPAEWGGASEGPAAREPLGLEKNDGDSTRDSVKVITQNIAGPCWWLSGGGGGGGGADYDDCGANTKQA